MKKWLENVSRFSNKVRCFYNGIIADEKSGKVAEFMRVPFFVVWLIRSVVWYGSFCVEISSERQLEI